MDAEEGYDTSPWRGCLVMVGAGLAALGSVVFVSVVLVPAMFEPVREVAPPYGVQCEDSSEGLIRLAEIGPTAELGRLLEDGADPSVEDRHGNSPLACAGPEDDPERLDLLIAAGADPGTVARDDDSVLMDAAVYCLPAVMEVLLDRGADPDFGGPGRESPLTMSVALGDLVGVELLLDRGADATSVEVEAPMQGLVFGGPDPRIRCETPDQSIDLAIVAALLRSGTPPVEMARYSSYRGLRAGLDLALEAGATGQALDVPLVLAASAADADLVRVLLDHGADPGATGPVEQSIFSCLGAPEPTARCGGLMWLRSRTLFDVGDGEVVDDLPLPLRSDGLDVETTGLVEAAATGSTETVGLLLDAGADPTIRTSEGIAPLHVAAAVGDPLLVRLLLDFGADIPSSDHPTPSAVALAAGHTEIAAFLELLETQG